MNNLPKFSKEKKRILCVEDHKDTCELLAFLLSDYEIVFTDSIENSLKVFKQGNFDLCILDNWLTDGLGTELCRQIRQINSQIPIVFASGVAQKLEIDKAIEAGAQAYLIKPYFPKELQQLVKDLIGKDL